MSDAKSSYADKIAAAITSKEEEITKLLDAAEARMDKGEKGLKKTDRQKVAALEAEISDLAEDRKRAETRAERRTKIDAANKEKGTGPGARVVAEPRQYDPPRQGGLSPGQFLRDMYATQFPGRYVPQPGESGDPAARMDRHLREFERDAIELPEDMRGTPVPRHFFDSAAIRQSSTIDITGGATGEGEGGLVPQQYPAIVGRHLYAGAPFLALCSRYDIPTMGMQLSIPRFTAGPAGANQPTTTSTTGEEGEVADSAVTASNIIVPVVTATTRCRVTRQLIERGNMAEEYILDMQGQALKTSIDAKIIGSTTNPVGFIATTRATGHNIDQDAVTKSAQKVWQTFGLGIDKIARARFMAPDAICIHQRRATYLGFALDGPAAKPEEGRPLFQESAATAQNVLGIGRAAPMDAQMPEVVMRLAAGQNVFVDNNISITQDTDQDSALVFRRGDQHCWGQSMPYMVSWEQTAGTTLEVDLIGYEYYGFSSAVQPEGGCNVKGSLYMPSLTVLTT